MEVPEDNVGDTLIRMRVSPQARRKCPALPEFWQARAITVIDPQARKQILFTSLLDRKRYTAADIAACYATAGT